MDNTNQKLEVFRRVYCLGANDIDKVFRSAHLHDKYNYYREKDGVFGNYSFLMYLDTCNAKTLLDYVGFKGDFTLSAKGGV